MPLRSRVCIMRRADASASLLRQMQAILGDGNVKAEEKQG